MNLEKCKFVIFIIVVIVVFYILFLFFVIFMLYFIFINCLVKEYIENESNVEVLKVLSFFIVVNSFLNFVLYVF